MTPVGAQSIWKASTRLADGREIVYFDEAPGLDRVLARDTRPLPPRSPGPPSPSAVAGPGVLLGSPEQGIRWDPLAGEWVVIAAARQDRAFLPPADLERMVAQACVYQGGNLFDDLVAAESRAGTRIVARNGHWVAFVPEAAPSGPTFRYCRSGVRPAS